MKGKNRSKSIKIGVDYAIPCVRVAGLEWIRPEEWLPVIGPLHEDAEFLNFPVEHYHIDFRFVDPTAFTNVVALYAKAGDTSQLLGLVIGKTQIIEGPVQQQLRCRRLMPVYPIHSHDAQPLHTFARWKKPLRMG